MMRILLSTLLIFTMSYANEQNLLTKTKQEIIELEKKQIEEKSKSNQYDWLNNINVNAYISNNQDEIQSEDYSLSISQDIFKFGGISSQIKYAKELKKMENINLNINTKNDLSSLFSLLIDVKLNEISLNQNILNIENSLIDIKNKKSEYQEGELGISDLNDAIMKKNSLQNTQKELILTKEKNINNIKEYTNKNINQISIPDIKLPSKEIFLKNANTINYANKKINVNKKLYKIQKSSYLPKLSIDGKYGYSNSDTKTGDDYYSYGLSLSVPFSYTSSNDIEQKHLDYLISTQELKNEIIQSELKYNEVLLSIKSYKERILLAQEDINLYDELLKLNNEEYNAGYKTIDDIQTLENSKKIRQFDIKNYQLNIKKQIISLYFMM